MFSQYQGFNPEGERLLVLTLAAGLTREQPARAPWPWLRRIVQPRAAVPVEAETSARGGEQFAPSKS